MTFKKAVKRIKKLVNEAEGSFVHDSVWLRENDNLEGGKSLEVLIQGESVNREDVAISICFNNQMPEKDIYRKYTSICFLLGLDSIEDVLGFVIPPLYKATFSKTLNVCGECEHVDRMSWNEDGVAGEILNLSTSTIASYSVTQLQESEKTWKAAVQRDSDLFKEIEEKYKKVAVACFEEGVNEGVEKANGITHGEKRLRQNRQVALSEAMTAEGLEL